MISPRYESYSIFIDISCVSIIMGCLGDLQDGLVGTMTECKILLHFIAFNWSQNASTDPPFLKLLCNPSDCSCKIVFHSILLFRGNATCILILGLHQEDTDV